MNNYIAFDIETTGLNPWYDNRITCICAKDSNGQTFKQAGDEEKEIILNFINWINNHKDILDNFMFVSANGKDFDIPFIMTRCVWNNISFFDSNILLRIEHYDLQQLTSRKISLNDLGSLLFEMKKSGNGLTAIVLATERRWDELIKYCMDDVILTEKVYLKLKEFKK